MNPNTRLLYPNQDAMDRLNIAFYTDTYLPAVDGVVVSMLNFKRELESRGHKVYIFASGKKTQVRNRNTFIYHGVGFKPYPQYNVAIFPYNSMLKLRSLDVDIVHAQTPFVMGFAALMAAKLGRYPLVSTFHTIINSRNVVNAYYPKNERLKKITKKYVWMYTKFFYGKSDLTIAPTHAVQSFLSNHGINNTMVVPNSVDIRRFNPETDGTGLRRAYGIRDDEKVVLYLGRLGREKKLEVMLRAAKIILRKRNDVRFVIGGHGPAEGYYRDVARRLGIADRVKFLGFVSEKELPHLYAMSDMFCMPSTFETQGVVSLEAMATGKPVVGADYLGLKDTIIKGKNGERFAPGDYTECARKIEKVLNNSATYRKGAIETAREFSIERATDRLLEAYNFVLSKRAID